MCLGIANSEVRNGIPQKNEVCRTANMTTKKNIFFRLVVQNEVPSVFIFWETVYNGILIIFIFRRMVQNKVRKFRVFFSSTKCCGTEFRAFYYLPWNGLELNFKRFTFRETDGIQTE
jgi:hypothetical protein